jgi:hypothetical protein
MRRARNVSWLLVVALPVLVARSARADEPAEPPPDATQPAPQPAGQPADPADEGYELAIAEGLQHFGAARWQAAYEAFVRANFLRPSARALRGMGMAAFNLGRIAQARAHLEAALVEPQRALTEQQRAHVLELLQKARARTGRFRVHTTPAQAELMLDGRSIVERELLLDVGSHELSAQAVGHRLLRRTLEVRGAEDQLLELALVAEAQPAAAASAPERPVQRPRPRSAPRAQPASAPSATPWGQIVLALSGAVLVGALVTGHTEQRTESELDALCPGRACEPERAGRAAGLSAEIRTLQTTTDVLLLTGLIGAGIGTWLWVSADDGPPERALTLSGRW